MIIGIDASNIRVGGGLTHLKNLLRFAKPERSGVRKVIVWGGKHSLEKLPQETWLDLREISMLNRSLAHRLYWQNITLTSLARKNCDLLFVPGGLYLGVFRPYVSMCQNLLPFADEEISRYGLSGSSIRIKLLARGQAHTFAHSDGIIFLTQHVRDILLTKYSHLQNVRQSVIPHGIDPVFFRHNTENKKKHDPIRLLYVSSIDLYKHQWNVVSSVSSLRKEGINIQLTLVGSAYPPALEKLKATIEKVDPNMDFVKYEGLIDHNELTSYYNQADLFVFASSCENLPIILLEAMASSLPIACSNRLPMPEVLGDAGIYFEPEDLTSINNALRKLISSPKLRKIMAKKAQERVNKFTWEQCAYDTFEFLSASTQIPSKKIN